MDDQLSVEQPIAEEDEFTGGPEGAEPPSNTPKRWSLYLERCYLLEVIVGFGQNSDWGSKLRERHGSVLGFLYSYKRALAGRYLSFSCSEPMSSAEREVMEMVVNRLIVTHQRRSKELRG